jgi:endonuclease YncB( thermonuclease family)
MAVPFAVVVAGVMLRTQGDMPRSMPENAPIAEASLQKEADPLRAWTGRVSVIDGDSIEMRGENLRLHGVDAPESAQTCERDGASWRCGQQAALALADFIGESVVSCDQFDTDLFDRPVVRCFLRQRDINAWLVSEGWAVAFRRYSKDYVAEEDAARTAKRGIWAGNFELPEDYRSKRRKKTSE